jgi:hypothetical protein
MAALATRLQNLFAAAASGNRGATAPENPFEGMGWWDTDTSPVEILKRYTVTGGWASILSVDITTGAVTILGTIAIAGGTNPGDIVTIDGTQILTNKTIAGGTVNPTVLQQGGVQAVTTTGTQTLTNKTVTGGTVNPTTLQQGGVQAVTTTGVQTLTNKTITSPVLNGGAALVVDSTHLNVIGSASSGSSAAGGSLTGTIYWVKLGGVVFVSWGTLSHSSASQPASAAGVIPAGFRPGATNTACNYSDSNGSWNCYISAAGTLTLNHRDTSGQLTARTSYHASGMHYMAA